MEGVFVPFGFFAMVVAIVYLRQRKLERFLIIEKGLDPSMFDSHKPFTIRSLKWGIMLVGLGLGMLIANILARTVYFSVEEAYFSMLFLFGGASLLIYYFIDRKRKNGINQQ